MDTLLSFSFFFSFKLRETFLTGKEKETKATKTNADQKKNYVDLNLSPLKSNQHQHFIL